ncbi:hypothetical protein DPMN_115549 [Dreissena polymorpha]|uniref:Scavenger receptor cysteine-rich domain-containing protein DMBT1 n=1 Tax=Dreissena polymorpha TaxID=45954 RepID=A0A9D4KLX4_DREPO|nr:hypothetical protein DPMN_115549 [Dreissena polymorpha]
MDHFSLLVFGLFLLPLAFTETQVRLVQDGSAYRGYVEILYDGQWRALCYDNIQPSTETANVICGMLRNTTQYTVNATLSASYQPDMTSGISLPNLRCDGDEMDILFCKSNRWSVQGICPYGVVHVSCNTQVYSNMVNGGVVGNPYTIFHICQDYFSHADATVYCRTAYLPSWNVSYTTGANTDYSSYKLRLGCQGNEEDVSECNVYETYCNGNPYNGVNIFCNETEIILRGGPNNLHGTISVYENGYMRYICSDGFGPNEARAVCANLNGTAVTGKITRSYVGSNYGLITNLRCHGMESDISMCTSTRNGYCSSGYAAAVDCNEVRLMDGTDDSSGRLEIYNTSSNSWSTVCQRAGFSYAEANVVCRQLGFSNGLNGYSTSGNGGKGDIFTSVFHCRGYEWDLNDCIVDHHRSVHCSHQDDIYLNCGNYYTTQTTTLSPTQVRLVGGGYNSGRVEVYYEGQWGTVCARNFDYRDMEVICRTLGYYSGGGRFYTGNAGMEGNVMIEHLDCHGNEYHLDQCPSKAWLSNTCDHSEDISIDCGYYDYTSTQHMPQSHNGQATDGDIRLSNGGYDHGRLEVFYNNRWGTVCMRGFDYNDARTVCRILGLYQGDSYLSYYDAINAYGLAYTNILVEDLRCQGDEWSLAQCDSGRPWTNTTCDHYYYSDVGVSCRGNYYSTSTPVPVMSSSHSQCGGHFYGTSGLITSPNYPNNYGDNENCIYNINVPSGFSVCLQFDNFTTETCCDHLIFYDGPSTGYRQLVSLSGQSNETHMCTSGNYLTAQFRTDGSVTLQGFEANYTAVRLNAYRDNIRLVDGLNNYTGRVEIFHDGQWGTVCDDDFGYEEVVVVCRMLGLFQGQGYGRFYTSSVTGTGQIWLDDLGCHGHEYSLDQCRSSGWGSHNCGHGEDVGVNCNDYSGNYYTSEYTTQLYRTETTTYRHSMTTGTSEQVRLVNGPNYHSGRVEVYHNGQWGTICDDNFDHLDVIVICRMLGLYQGSSYGQAYSGAHFGQGSGQIWLDTLECNGYESSISQCSHQSWGSHDCSHSEDAGVDCYANIYETTAIEYASTTFPRWQTTFNPWWQTTAGYTIQDAIRVGCSETGWDIQVDMGMLRRVYPNARASDIYLGENTCTGVESWYRVVFQQGLKECITSETVRHDVLVYSNQLVYAERDPVHSFIIRHYNWTVGVECDIQRNESSSGHIEHENNNHQGGPLLSGYTVNMTFYLDPNFQQPISSNPLRLPVGTDVYVKVFTQATDWTVKMRVHTCYTKPSPTSPDHLRYNLIQNGCEVDTNTHLISQSTHETRFVFQDFEYTSNHQGIHVMCDATFCSTFDYSRQCTQTCNPIIRRNVNVKPVDDVTKSSFDVTDEGVRDSDSKTDEAAHVEQTKSYGNHA